MTGSGGGARGATAEPWELMQLGAGLRHTATAASSPCAAAVLVTALASTSYAHYQAVPCRNHQSECLSTQLAGNSPLTAPPFRPSVFTSCLSGLESITLISMLNCLKLHYPCICPKPLKRPTPRRSQGFTFLTSASGRRVGPSSVGPVGLPSTTVNTPLCLHWCLWATLFLKAQEPFLGVPLTHLCGLRAHPSGGFTEGTVTSGSYHTRTSKDGEFHGPMLRPGLSNSSAANTPCLRGASSQRHSEHVHRAACQTSTIPSSRPLFPSS